MKKLDYPIILTIANRKGGVAKTTTSGYIASFIRKAGYSCLLIDMDSQADLSIYNKVYDEKENNTYNFLTGKPFRIKKDIISTNFSLYNFNENIKYKSGELLKQIVAFNKKKHYDFIVIDTSPSLDKLTMNSLVASSNIIIPTQAERGAYEGTRQTLQIIKQIQDNTNPKLRVAGILFTGYNDRSILHKQFLKQYDLLAKQYKARLFNNHIPKGIAIAEAQALGKEILEYNPNSKPTKAYKKVVDELLEFINNRIEKEGDIL